MARPSRATIRDVARLAGVAPSTVSMALSNHAEIAEDTRRTIREAAAKLQYTPNHAARSMRGELERAIGVVIPHSSAHVFSHPYFMGILGGITEVANDRDFMVILSTAREENRGEIAYVKMLRERRVDGIILASAPLFDRNVMELALSGFPFVFLGRYPLNADLAAVGVDDTGGAALMAAHLLGHGYRSIVHITGPLQHLSAMDRRDGFRQAMAGAGIAVHDQDLIEGDYSEESGRLAAERILERPQLPEAVFAGNDEMAYGALTVFRRHGLRVPEDIALAGFDNLDIARVMSPSLTTVLQPIHQLGAAAAERLIALAEQRQPLETQSVLPVTIAVRTSCGCRSA